MGNVIQKRIEDADGNILLQKNFVYDDTSRCIEREHTETLLKTIYDPFGEPISYLDALGNETKVIVRLWQGIR